MRLWNLLPTKAQQYLAMKINHYGYRKGNNRLVVWGLTHFPIVIEEEQK